MSKISLKHSGGNVVSLNSPTSAPTSADVAFKLPNADGTSGQVLKTDGSGNLSFGADTGGKVLQVKHMIIAGEFSTTSSSYADTGLTLSITPASTSSKILQLYNILGAQNTNSSGNEARIKGFRDSTEIFATNDYMRLKADGSSTRHYNGLFMMDLDDPSTTSSVTYKLQAAMTGGSGTFFVQNYSNFTLMEIAS